MGCFVSGLEFDMGFLETAEKEGIPALKLKSSKFELNFLFEYTEDLLDLGFFFGLLRKLEFLNSEILKLEFRREGAYQRRRQLCGFGLTS